VTHFDTDDRFDVGAYRNHVAWLLEHEPSGFFAAGGTGEFFSLRPDEVGEVVGAAVAEVRGRVPVIAGCGYGTAMAIQIARDAEKRGADGLLLLPPYLVNADQQGLAAHIEKVCRSVSIGVIVYNRDNAIVTEETLVGLCERNANLVGFKDGVGDLELLARVYSRLGKRLTYIGGMPTAETYALPYQDLGFDTYSSAIFNFMPVWAKRFFGAVRGGDRATVQNHLRDFVMPYIAIRNRVKGYAVSIVKAGLRVVGRPAGNVRSPLTDLRPAELEELRKLIERAQKIN
jgi:5-dehydro-4-deoxyglucarate dehydratase